MYHIIEAVIKKSIHTIIIVNTRELKFKLLGIGLRWLIPLGLILSAWAIFSIELPLIPAVGCNFSLQTIKGINNIFLALAYSYVAGVIVYWFTVKFPYIRNKYRLMPVIKNRIESIGNQLSNMNLEFRDVEHNPDVTDVEGVMSIISLNRWKDQCRMPIHSAKMNVTEAFINDYFQLCDSISALINDYSDLLEPEQISILEDMRSNNISTFNSVAKNSSYVFSDSFYEGFLQPAYRNMLENYKKLLYAK